ncbi:MAG TPA: hypothetical protein VMM84_08705 [Pyrinomonadaceae bacterium]|nr:hypothetical protein [Pyrinomonadaceae bacterium]
MKAALFAVGSNELFGGGVGEKLTAAAFPFTLKPFELAVQPRTSYTLLRRNQNSSSQEQPANSE